MKYGQKSTFHKKIYIILPHFLDIFLKFVFRKDTKDEMLIYKDILTI